MKIRFLSACICVMLLITVCGCGKDNDKGTNVEPQINNETYRNVKVIQIAGSAVLTRGEKQSSVYEQMLVNGDDSIATGLNSTVDLLLDSDKYARIYENSDVSFKLEGDSSKGAIRIYLNKGGLNNKIENKLSADDSYEVHTPDAVMAVRGTEFEVKVTVTDSSRQTEVTTSSGSVQITLLNDSGDQRLNEAGETTVIESTADGSGSMGKPQFKDEYPENTSSEETSSGEPEPSETVRCPKCSVELKSGETHVLTCGEAHYNCDGLTHGVCNDCRELLCDLSVHEAYECGVHYPCSVGAYDGHESLACGHYLCCIIDDAETVVHEVCTVCETYACQTDKEHFWAECGCVYCEGTLDETHILCDACGLCESDGKEHGLCEFCYACISDGREHGDTVCNNEIG